MFEDRRTPISYIQRVFSEGLLSYKMLVDYEVNGKEKHHEGKGSGSLILIPDNATKINVKFQVMRAPGVWSDVKEYDRFKKCWVEPIKPHIFKYDKPVSCTYTLAGNLYYEKVTKVSGDDDVDERIEQQYFCNGGWSSKMLVGYEEDGEVKFHEAHGSGNSVLIPDNATKIKVKFQVMRFPMVWSDVKEYDRFKKCWVKPTKPHIFEYDTPVSCTYTLDGSFFYEAVMKVSEDKELMYFCETLPSSKMLVDYQVNGEKEHYESHDSCSSILIPNNASKIKVKFQVKRPRGAWPDMQPDVWSDVKEDDDFKKCWVKPTKPHIFEYDTPVNCTYLLVGEVKNIRKDSQKKEYIKSKECISSHEPKHYNVKDATSSILMRHKAINVKAEFQDIGTQISVVEVRGKTVKGWDELEMDEKKKFPRLFRVIERLEEENKEPKQEQEKIRLESVTSQCQDIDVNGEDSLSFISSQEEKKESVSPKFDSSVPGRQKLPLSTILQLLNAIERLEKEKKELKQEDFKEKMRLESVTSQRQDIDVYNEDSLSFISSQEGSTNNEWFEENVFDENGDIKEIYVDELRSERFSGIKDFHIGINEEKKSWQMSITYARNTEPCMEDLKNLFGDNIASFVEFIRESDDEDEERLRTSSCFLRAPSSGDTLYVQNEERGTIAVLAAQVRSDEKHYVITSYHVCYCFDDLPENIFEAHNRLKEDCCSNDAAGCIGSRYQYMDQETLGVLGVFECGLYDNCNDIALIQLTPELTCVDAIAVLVNEVESQLLSKKQVLEIFKTYMNNGELPKVKKYGSASDETEGELFAITTARLTNDMNSGFYKIRGRNDDDFARHGDSGALVCIVHESKNLPFAIVSNHVPNGNVYYCPNLHQSIEALNKKYSWINIKPCIRQCGRF